MTIEEVKSRLRRYNELRRDCRKLHREIARRRADMTSPRAVKADALPGGRGNSLEAAIEKIDALEHRLRRLESDAHVRASGIVEINEAPYMLTGFRYRFETP